MDPGGVGTVEQYRRAQKAEVPAVDRAEQRLKEVQGE